MIAALVLFASAAPAQACDGELPQQEMNRCAHAEFHRVDAELNAQWRLTAAALKAKDARIDRSYDKEPGYFETLLAAQRAWLTWREHHCRGEGFEARGGSLSPFLVSTCMTALTRQRTRQLRELAGSEN